MLTDKISTYLSAARHISATYSTSLFVALGKLVYWRLVSNMGPEEFSFYSIPMKRTALWGDYISKWKWAGMLKRLNRPECRIVVEDKLHFYQHCRNYNIPTPEIFGTINVPPSQRPDSELPIIGNIDSFKSFAAKMINQDLLFKRITGSYGRGLMVARFAPQADCGLDERLLEEIYSQCLTTGESTDGSGYIIQERLFPDERIAKIMPKALGTIRILTIREAGQVKVLLTFVKIPTGKNHTDNFIHGRSGNLLGRINETSGAIEKVFGPVDKDNEHILLREVATHPDTNVMLRGFQIPQWVEMKELCISAAESFEGLDMIGFDVALTQKGIMILEGNWYSDVDALQLTQERGLAKMVREYSKTAA